MMLYAIHINDGSGGNGYFIFKDDFLFRAQNGHISRPGITLCGEGNLGGRSYAG